MTIDQQKLNQYCRQLLNMPEYSEVRDEFMELQKTGDMDAINLKMIDLKPVIEEEFQVSVGKQIPNDRLVAYTTKGGVPHLDDEYTVFGQVVAGMDVVDAIASQSTDEMDKPVEEVSMTVEVEEMKKSKITKTFGYQYPEE